MKLAVALQGQGVSPLLVYSKESSDSPYSLTKTELEITKCIKAVGSFQKPAFVAIKLSGLASEAELCRLERAIYTIAIDPRISTSRDFEIRATEVLNQFSDLWGRLNRLSEAAKGSKVQLVLDAEVRFHNEIDALPTSAVICSLLNRTGHHIWNTHQM